MCVSFLESSNTAGGGKEEHGLQLAPCPTLIPYIYIYIYMCVCACAQRYCFEIVEWLLVRNAAETEKTETY